MSLTPATRFRFTKGPAKMDRLEVLRADGRVERLDCPKQGIIPHDMVHWAVEHTLQARGFLGRVAQGEAAAFRMQADAGSDAVERLVEVFQGDQWSGGGSAPSELIALYAVTCDARACAPLPVDEAAVGAVRAVIEDLGRRWAALPVGGVLALELGPGG